VVTAISKTPGLDAVEGAGPATRKLASQSPAEIQQVFADAVRSVFQRVRAALRTLIITALPGPRHWSGQSRREPSVPFRFAGSMPAGRGKA